MLGITSSQPVHWPPSTSPAVAPVTPVGAVSPAQGTPRDPSSSSGFGAGREGRSGAVPDNARDRRASAEGTSPEAKAAPILPREQPEGVRSGMSSGTADAARNEEQAEEAQAKAEEQEAQQLRLQEVLSTVWKASAAVVDAVLGRDAVAAASAADPGLQAAEATRSVVLPGASADTATETAGSGGRSRPVQPVSTEPVAYSDQGASVWGVLETGTHLNQRV